VVKFGRNYSLYVQNADGKTIAINMPFTCEFEIIRNTQSSANVCHFNVYNLSPKTRSQIRKDQYNSDDKRSFLFTAGYGNQIAVGFQGFVTQAFSQRQGTTMVTQIESFDGGYAFVNAVTDTQFPSGTPQLSIVDALAKNLGLTIGAIGKSYQGSIQLGNSYSGNTVDMLREVGGKEFFIDDGKVHMLSETEVIATPSIPIINAATGLLNTPLQENRYINVEMLFEPRIRVAQLVNLQSSTAGVFDGLYKVLTIEHRGTISESVSGEATTKLGLLPGTFTEVSESTL
jgi:hypothetical protein